ncbi:MAG: hypothetical protein ICV70_07090 [Jiangellaceae bacterium]|nr:hypothetical protein [Jiangellaceae bacterium]
MSAQVSSPAERLRRPRWLDPRLLVGVLLVVGSVVLGTRVIAAADQTTPVLVAASDLAPGQPLLPGLVDSRNVNLGNQADRYLTGQLGQGYVVVRAVRTGEFLPRSAIAAAGDTDAIRYVTVAVPATEVPAGLGAGAVVDVWRTPAADASPASGDRAATRLLRDVTVTSADLADGALGTTGGQAGVTLAVTGDALTESVGALLAAARDGLVYLIRVPEAAE